MLKNFMTKLLMVLGLLGTSAITHAAEEHHHDKGQRGGVVMSFGDSYHIEAVRSADKVTFYVMGGDGKSPATITKHSGGSIVLVIPGTGEVKTEIPAGAALSEVSAPAAAKGTITAMLKLIVEGKSLSAKFSLKN